MLLTQQLRFLVDMVELDLYAVRPGFMSDVELVCELRESLEA